MGRTTSLRIAMIGQKGLPATWGGVEHHVEQIGARLAQRGHQVTVYCRPHYGHGGGDSPSVQPTLHRGMRLVSVPTVRTKHFDAISHSAACTLHALRDGVDVVHYHAIGPGLLAPLPRYLSRSGVVVTVHGLDGSRAKWGGLAQRVLQVGERVSATVPQVTVVVSRALQEHYAARYGRDTAWIPNGVDAPPAADAQRVVGSFGLEPGRYLLYVGRLVPEKNPDLLVRAFRDVPGDARLVLAGGSSFSDDYAATVRRDAAQDPRVVLPGYVYGPDLAALYAGAAAFVLPSSVEGLPLTLLEAASHGTPVIVSDIPPHLEVLGADGPGQRVVATGDVTSLARAMTEALADPAAGRRAAQALQRDVLSRYRWDAAADQLEDAYAQALGSRTGRRQRR